MPPYTEFMEEAKRAAKPVYHQIVHEAGEDVSQIAMNPQTWGFQHEAVRDFHLARKTAKPYTSWLAGGTRSNLAYAASTHTAMQAMHELHNGMHIANEQMLYVERGDGMWGMVVVLFLFAIILAAFYIFGFFERIEAWIGVFVLLMLLVFYMDWMTGDHYNYYKTEPYQGIETNTAY